MAGVAGSAIEVGLVLYRDCQIAMVHGITDLFAIASVFSQDRGGPKLRVSHWSMGEGGEFSRCHDTEPGRPGHPDIFVVPGRLTGPAEIEEAAPYARWLLDRHAQGATLAASCGGSFIIAATGLLSGRPATTHWLFCRTVSRALSRYPAGDRQDRHRGWRYHHGWRADGVDRSWPAYR